jgi:hypothetical protein
MTTGKKVFLLGFVLIFFASYLTIIFGYRQFGGYDLSPLIDLSWRFSRGETPGVDFINTFPPLLLVFIKPEFKY